MDSETQESGGGVSGGVPGDARAASRPVGRADRAARLAFALLVAAAAGWFLLANAALCINASPDYAVVLAMSRDMAHARAFPVFFYRQAYMGSLEPAFGALFCRLFGDGPFVASLGAAVPGFAAVLLLALLARRLSGRLAGCLAILLAVPGPWVWTHYLVSPRGGYALAVLLVVAGLRIASASPVFLPGGDRRIRARTFAAFGFVCGLAFWNDWLALPFLFGSALVLLARTGLRVFSPRAWAAGAAAFLAGSLPWWIWNARHRWESLVVDSPAAATPRPGEALREAAGPRLAAFFGSDGGAAAFWRSPLPWFLLALFALAVAGIAVSRRRRTLAPAAAAAGLGAAAFAAVYCWTPFGAVESSRYLVPLVPGATLVCAAGLAELAAAVRAGGASPLRRAAPALAAAAALACAAAQVRTCVPLLRDMRSGSEERRDEFLRWADVPGLDRPAFGDYTLFPVHWITGERVCIVSPRGGRSQICLDRLEAEPSPSVAENHSSFSSFLAATGAKAEKSREGGVLVHRSVRPPPRADVGPRDAIARIVAPDGSDAAPALLDGNVATFRADAASAGGAVSYEIELDAPRVVCGVAATCGRRGSARGWTAEAVEPDGSASPLARQPEHRGWFWSGPRFYLGGTDERWVLRWKPRRLERIRVSFSGSGPGTSPRLDELRLLEPARTPPLDEDAVAAAVARARSGPEPVRLFADRWLAGRLGGVPRDPTVDTQARGAASSGDARDARTRLDPRRKNLVVVPAALAAETEAVLADAGFPFSRSEAGGAALFLAGGLGEEAGAAAEESFGGCLRFEGGRLVADRPVPPDVPPERAVFASFAGGRLELLGCTRFPDPAVRGETARAGFLFRVPRRGARIDGGWIVVEFHRDGRAVFATGTPLSRPDPRAGAPDLPDFDHRAFPFRVPDDLPPGEYDVLLGVRRRLESRRFVPVEPGPGVETRGRAVVLPWKVRVE